MLVAILFSEPKTKVRYIAVFLGNGQLLSLIGNTTHTIPRLSLSFVSIALSLAIFPINPPKQPVDVQFQKIEQPSGGCEYHSISSTFLWRTRQKTRDTDLWSGARARNADTRTPDSGTRSRDLWLKVSWLEAQSLVAQVQGLVTRVQALVTRVQCLVTLAQGLVTRTQGFVI